MGQSAALNAARIAVGVAVIWTAFAVVTLGQRQTADDLPAIVRNAILNERLTFGAELSTIRTNIALVQRTADDARQEIREMRNALYGIVATLVGSILLQFVQFKKTRGAT